MIVAGNDKDRPQEIPRLLEPIVEDGCHLVQGSRYLPGGSYGNMPAYRRVATQVLHPLLLSLLTRQRMTDSTNGFRAIRLDLFDDARINLHQEWLDRLRAGAVHPVQGADARIPCPRSAGDEDLSERRTGLHENETDYAGGGKCSRRSSCSPPAFADSDGLMTSLPSPSRSSISTPARALPAELQAAFDRVLDRSSFILGEEVAQFEQEFAAYRRQPRTRSASVPGSTRCACR